MNEDIVLKFCITYLIKPRSAPLHELSWKNKKATKKFMDANGF